MLEVAAVAAGAAGAEVRPLRLLVASIAPGAAGPQCDLDDLLRAPAFRAAFTTTVWAVPDAFRGVVGKLKLLAAVRGQLRAARPQVIYLNLDLSLAFWIALMCRIGGKVPLVTHSKNGRYDSPARPWAAALFGYVLAHLSRARLAISADAGRAMFGKGASAIERVPATIDFAHLHRGDADLPAGLPPKTGLIFACVGRLCAQKNQALAVAALALMRDRGLSAQLWLIGAGADQEPLRALIARLEVSARVHLLGEIAELGPLYRERIDVLLVPSLFEGQGRVVAEAQSFGIPVLASVGVPQAAFLELAPVRAQRLVFVVEDWAQAMARMLTDPPPRRVPSAQALRESALGIERGSQQMVELLRAAADPFPARERHG